MVSCSVRSKGMAGDLNWLQTNIIAAFGAVCRGDCPWPGKTESRGGGHRDVVDGGIPRDTKFARERGEGHSRGVGQAQVGGAAMGAEFCWGDKLAPVMRADGQQAQQVFGAEFG